MAHQALANRRSLEATPLTPPPTTPDVTDARFRALLGEANWAQLPEPVRRRFSEHLAPGTVAVYRGHVIATRISRAGRILAQLTRLIGAPLPTFAASSTAIVAVTDEPALQGQRWVRLYDRPGYGPQMIQSVKRFRGETGLEEHVGAGIAMQLGVSVEAGALVFRSQRYLWKLGRWHITLPTILSPGDMTIVHRQEADGSFAFHLTLEHPLFGLMVDQLAAFRDT